MSSRKCPKGTHYRKSFTRKFRNSILKTGYTVRRKGRMYTVKPGEKVAYVPSRCIKNRNESVASTKTFGKLRKGELIRYGYQYRLADRVRHKALEAAAEAYGATSVWHKLDAVAKLTKHAAPDAHAIFLRDRDWIKEHLL
jgi:hypothetical protein